MQPWKRWPQVVTHKSKANEIPMTHEKALLGTTATTVPPRFPHHMSTSIRAISSLEQHALSLSKIHRFSEEKSVFSRVDIRMLIHTELIHTELIHAHRVDMYMLHFLNSKGYHYP